MFDNKSEMGDQLYITVCNMLKFTAAADSPSGKLNQRFTPCQKVLSAQRPLFLMCLADGMCSKIIQIRNMILNRNTCGSGKERSKNMGYKRGYPIRK